MHNAQSLLLRRRLAPGAFLLASMTTAGVHPAHAQEPAASPTPTLQIVQQQTVDMGSHRIIFNRVVPPPPQPASTPSAKTPSSAFTVTYPGYAAGLSTTEDGADFAQALFVGATVYDGQFTDLHGTDAQGSWRAWSNVDFNLLASVNEFGTTSTVYSLYLFVGSDTLDPLSQAGLYPTSLSSLPAGRAGYLFTDGSTAAKHPETAAALDALHRFHDAYRPQLLQAYQQRQAEQAAQATQAEWARQHPTPTPDTVISFWPKQGSIFLGN